MVNNSYNSDKNKGDNNVMLNMHRKSQRRIHSLKSPKEIINIVVEDLLGFNAQ